MCKLTKIRCDNCGTTNSDRILECGSGPCRSKHVRIKEIKESCPQCEYCSRRRREAEQDRKHRDHKTSRDYGSTSRQHDNTQAKDKHVQRDERKHPSKSESERKQESSSGSSSRKDKPKPIKPGTVVLEDEKQVPTSPAVRAATEFLLKDYLKRANASTTSLRGKSASKKQKHDEPSDLNRSFGSFAISEPGDADEDLHLRPDAHASKPTSTTETDQQHKQREAFERIPLYQRPVQPAFSQHTRPNNGQSAYTQSQQPSYAYSSQASEAPSWYNQSSSTAQPSYMMSYARPDLRVHTDNSSWYASRVEDDDGSSTEKDDSDDEKQQTFTQSRYNTATTAESSKSALSRPPHSPVTPRVPKKGVATPVKKRRPSRGERNKDDDDFIVHDRMDTRGTQIKSKNSKKRVSLETADRLFYRQR